MRCLAFLIEARMTLRKIDTAGVEIQPTAARERIAKVVLDDLGLGFATAKKRRNTRGVGQSAWLFSAGS